MIHTTPKQPLILDYYKTESDVYEIELNICHELIHSKIKQNKIQGYIERASFWMILGNYELALKDIQKGKELSPDEPSFYTMGAEILNMQGDINRASLSAHLGVQKLENAKSNDSTLCDCNIDYCYIVAANIALLQGHGKKNASQQQHYEDALANAQKVFTRNPEDANAQKIVARIPFNYFLVEALLKSLPFQSSPPEQQNAGQRTGRQQQEPTQQSDQSYSNQNLSHSPNNCQPEEEKTQTTYATVLSQTSHASLNETSSTGTTHSMQTSLQQPTSDKMSIDFPVQTHSTPPTTQQYNCNPNTSPSLPSFQTLLSSLNSVKPGIPQQHQEPTQQSDPMVSTQNTPRRINPRRECRSHSNRYSSNEYYLFKPQKESRLIRKLSQDPKSRLDRRPSHRR